MSSSVTPIPPHFDGDAVASFIRRWQGVQLTDSTELATSQSFVIELCALLGVPTPLPTADQAYMFERPLKEHDASGAKTDRRVDCYRRGCFVWESKKLRQLKFGTDRYNSAMLAAHAQAQAYARALPAAEGRVPFLLVVDVGHVIELYADFTRSGATYTAFPDPRSYRIALADLGQPGLLERLRSVWTDPDSLDPSRASARVTRQVANQLGSLAKAMEASGHRPDHVAAFLSRSLFSMFAEDVELLPKGSFLQLLKAHRHEPATLMRMLRVLWMDMDRGGFSAALRGEVLQFNGKLFKGDSEHGYSLLLDTSQIDQLIAAASANWREVEPAIFGTLLERALDPTERHALGAHYTPRAYVERLVMPTVIEPLRAEWADAQAAAVLLARQAEQAGDAKKATESLAAARSEVRRFHHRLCTLRVLDPACGSGNFLYVTLEHLKRLEGEVLNQMHAFDAEGDSHEVRQDRLGFEGETVTLQQLRGIEINPRAAALAELVLWIGYLQWHIRTRGNAAVAEPVVHDYGNIECRDAVLAWDDVELAYDSDGVMLTRWDGASLKPHSVTGSLVPDEMAQVPQWRYVGARRTEWPRVDFIVGNPPFIGSKRMRDALGDGYVDALRQAWKGMPENCDFVMYWWEQAAEATRAGIVKQFGFITTNSLRQVFNRRVIDRHLTGTPALVLRLAVPDHPWVDAANGAAVRIAMTVANTYSNIGELVTVTKEVAVDEGEVLVEVASQSGALQSDLRIGANLSAASPLLSNARLCWQGCKLVGAGFQVSPHEAQQLVAVDNGVADLLKRYWAGGDLTKRRDERSVIDTYGLTEDQLRSKYPAAFQRLLNRVYPERAQNRDAGFRTKWWLFGRPRPDLREACSALRRYFVTSEVAKHRFFVSLEWPTDLIDGSIVAVASDDAFHLGVLSSFVHVSWALAAGGRMGVGNDPRYQNGPCFDNFPFPDDDTGLSPALRQRIATLAEQIDAHRKRQQAAHPTLTMTGIYNVLEALRAAGPRFLTQKEQAIYDQGLVGVLRELHDELDAAVLSAYGCEDLGPALATGDSSLLLERLAALNARRAAEEQAGHVRWLRPMFQNEASAVLAPERRPPPEQEELELQFGTEVAASPAGAGPARTWPSTLPEQMRAVVDLLAASSAGLSLADLGATFRGRGPWKKGLPRILETLEAVGRAYPFNPVDSGERRWRAT